MCKRHLIIVLLLSVYFVLVSEACAGVIVFDDITLKGKPVLLKARVQRIFMPKGGERVEFFVENKKVGYSLTGFDGYAFFEYRPSKRTLLKIKARVGEESSEGHLLVLNKKDKILFIDFDGLLLKESLINIKESKKAIRSLKRCFSIVYLTSFAGIAFTKSWLVKKGYPEAVVIRWSEDILEDLKSRGLNLYGIALSSATQEPPEGYIKKIFIMDEEEHPLSWEDLLSKTGCKWK